MRRTCLFHRACTETVAPPSSFRYGAEEENDDRNLARAAVTGKRRRQPSRVSKHQVRQSRLWS